MFSPSEIFARWFEESCMMIDEHIKHKNQFPVLSPVIKGKDMDNINAKWRDLMSQLPSELGLKIKT